MTQLLVSSVVFSRNITGMLFGGVSDFDSLLTSVVAAFRAYTVG